MECGQHNVARYNASGCMHDLRTEIKLFLSQRSFFFWHLFISKSKFRCNLLQEWQHFGKSPQLFRCIPKVLLFYVNPLSNSSIADKAYTTTWKYMHIDGEYGVLLIRHFLFSSLSLYLPSYLSEIVNQQINSANDRFFSRFFTRRWFWFISHFL